MTTGFSIDDVRDTLTADVTRFLSRIETAARELCERPDLGVDTVPRAVPMFQDIGDHGHAIHGTTSLVDASSLSSSAELLERLALLGRDDLARAARHLERAREIAKTIAAGAGDMLAMLSLELDSRQHEADKVAASWRMRAEETLAAHATQASAVALPVHEPPGEKPAAVPVRAADSFAFDEDWSEPAPEAAPASAVPREEVPRAFSFASSEAEASVDVDTGAIDVELALIFEEEARETLDALAGQLDALAANPGDRNVCRELERSYHTLKGAAATVGLVAISEKAAELQHRVEAIFDTAEAASPELIASLAAETAALRRAGGIEPRPAPAPASESLVGSLVVADDVRVEFERESEALVDAAEQLVSRLSEAPVPQLVEDLAKTLHRLKGSALVVGATSLGNQAAQLEELARASTVDVPAIAAGIARFRTMLGLAAPPSQPSSSTDEMRSVFAAEARTIMQEAHALASALRDASDPGAAREQLRQLLHRLKGSATIVREHAVARAAAALHDDVTGAVGGSEIEVRLSRIGEQLDPHSRKRSEQRVRFEVPVPDRELEAGFQQECADLLDTLERAVVALERSERPKDHIGGLLGTYHTLKGAVNAIGLRPTGDLIHRVEDFVETLQRAAIVPPLKGVVSVLLQVHGEIRRHLETLRHGYVEVMPGRWEERLRRVLSGESRATAVPSSDHPDSRFGDGSEASGPSGTTDHGDRRHIRVSIDRLDALMNFAGELVINRSRLLSRIEGLQLQQVDLGRTSRRLTDIVERFREEHEFSMVSRNERAAARVGQWGAFSELELDQYEDVNILARSLAESSTDMQDVFAQLGLGLAGLADDSDALGAIIGGMQGEITRARMIPLGSLFSRLQLPIRDAAQREQREVRIVTEGDDVHLDKTIVDALLQPMLHLVRNSVAHGLETPARRAAAGKPATGVIRLRARQELGQIALEVYDDGAGLDLPKLHARGVAMGLITADVPLDDPRVRDLVFVPGMTTSTHAGAISGRGVGCDVVRRAVERLNGSIRVESVAGRSTSFVITLPLTLAISRALLLRQGGQMFAVPLNFIERIIEVQGRQIVDSAGRRRVELDDGFVTLRALGEFLGYPSARDDGPVVVLRVGDQRLVVQVDAVAGQEEVVVKRLGALLTGHPTFAGVTIRGTGEIVLILDVPSIVEAAGAGREAQPARATPALVPETVEPEKAPPVGKLRVLFVDDSVSVRKVAERALEALGVAVTLAVDGVDALEKLHAHPFDIVFTDLEMPRMHGYELIRELRFLPAFRSLPVIVVTSRSGKKHREEAQAVGATHYMTKPFSPQSLEAALSRFGGPRAAALRSGSGGEEAS
jgi:chemosensory pili system protein ChpA (sensor histidine kinase/response regulator)